MQVAVEEMPVELRILYRIQ